MHRQTGGGKTPPEQPSTLSTHATSFNTYRVFAPTLARPSLVASCSTCDTHRSSDRNLCDFGPESESGKISTIVQNHVGRPHKARKKFLNVFQHTYVAFGLFVGVPEALHPDLPHLTPCRNTRSQKNAQVRCIHASPLNPIRMGVCWGWLGMLASTHH